MLLIGDEAQTCVVKLFSSAACCVMKSISQSSFPAHGSEDGESQRSEGEIRPKCHNLFSSVKKDYVNSRTLKCGRVAGV